MNRSGPSVPPSSLRRTPLDRRWPAFLKRSIDIMVLLVVHALVMAWLWPLIALAIKLDSRGPVFYKQERYGWNNKRFLCFKFRSMIKDSRDCAAQGRYRPTEEKDERLTWVGRVLRKASLDELPQFLNILKGEMSFLAPREASSEVPGRTQNKDCVSTAIVLFLLLCRSLSLFPRASWCAGSCPPTPSISNTPKKSYPSFSARPT